MAPRDNQRSRLYTAERSIRSGIDFKTVEEVQGFADEVCGRRWFRSRWGTVRITVKDGRGYRIATAYKSSKVIQMPLWARSRIVTLHEMAHCIVPSRYASHGPEYAGVLLFLLRSELGEEAGTRLKEAFKKYRVRYNMTAVPPPVKTVVTKAAVAARVKESRSRVPTLNEITEAADVIRRAAKNGAFGVAGSKPRTRALETARKLEGLSPRTTG